MNGDGDAQRITRSVGSQLSLVGDDEDSVEELVRMESVFLDKNVNVEHFDTNTDVFFGNSSFIFDQITEHSKLITVRKKTEESLSIVQEQTCLTLVLNILRNIFGVQSVELMDNSFDMTFMTIPNEENLRSIFKEIFTISTGTLNFKRGFTDKIKEYLRSDVTLSLDMLLQLCYFGTLVLGNCNNIIQKCGGIDSDIICSQMDNVKYAHFIKVYNLLSEKKFLPILFYKSNLVKVHGLHLKTAKYLNVRISNLLKISLVTNMHFGTLKYLWNLFPQKPTAAFNHSVAEHWKQICSKYSNIFDTFVELIEAPVETEDILDVQPSHPCIVIPMASTVLGPDNSSQAVLDKEKVSRQKRKKPSSNTVESEDVEELLSTPSVAYEEQFKHKYTKLSRLIMRYKPIGTDDASEIECDKCNECFSVNNPALKCDICKSSYHSISVASCSLAEELAPTTEDLKTLYKVRGGRVPAHFLRACTCAQCSNELLGLAYSCATKDCVGSFCGSCYSNNSENLGETDEPTTRLIDQLAPSEIFILSQMLPRLFNESILDGINVNAMHVKPSELYEVLVGSTTTYNQSIQSFVLADIKKEKFKDVVRKYDISSEQLYTNVSISTKARLKAVFTLSGPIMYVSNIYNKMFEDGKDGQCYDVVASKGYMTFFHVDLEKGESFFSDQLMGKKIWFFYPNSDRDDGSKKPEISFKDFITNGCVYVQSAGSRIIWDKHAYHAVMHLTDTISQSGNV